MSLSALGPKWSNSRNFNSILSVIECKIRIMLSIMDLKLFHLVLFLELVCVLSHQHCHWWIWWIWTFYNNSQQIKTNVLADLSWNGAVINISHQDACGRPHTCLRRRQRPEALSPSASAAGRRRAYVCAGMWRGLHICPTCTAADVGSQAADVIDPSEAERPPPYKPTLPTGLQIPTSPPAGTQTSPRQPWGQQLRHHHSTPRSLSASRCFFPAVSYLSWSSSCCWSRPAAPWCPAENRG